MKGRMLLVSRNDYEELSKRISQIKLILFTLISEKVLFQKKRKHFMILTVFLVTIAHDLLRMRRIINHVKVTKTDKVHKRAHGINWIFRAFIWVNFAQIILKREEWETFWFSRVFANPDSLRFKELGAEGNRNGTDAKRFGTKYESHSCFVQRPFETQNEKTWFCLRFFTNSWSVYWSNKPFVVVRSAWLSLSSRS